MAWHLPATKAHVPPGIQRVALRSHKAVCCRGSRPPEPWLSLAPQAAAWHDTWRRRGIPVPRVFGAYLAQMPAGSRRQPRITVLPGRVRAAPPPSTSTVDPLVRARTRMSEPDSATMHESRAGVAQLAERPSCKRQGSGSIPLTGSVRLPPSGAVGSVREFFVRPEHESNTVGCRSAACLFVHWIKP